MRARNDGMAHPLGVTVGVASLTLAGLALFGGALAAQDAAPARPDSTAPRAVGAVRGTATAAGQARDSARPTPHPTRARGGFLARLARAYGDDWRGAAAADSVPAKRGYPAPIEGPPFPFSDWPYGGSVDIGAPWTQSSPLMEAITGASHGGAWKKSRIQIYGWLNLGGNLSTSHHRALGKYTNFPTAYDEIANAVVPDQEVLYIERQPNTVQRDHFDWGFRFTSLWGLDYRFTTAKGIFSDQLLTNNKAYGYDPVMFYVDLYFPHVAQGMNLRIGRYISLPDIEAQLAPNNYTYSHSLLYTFDCYTQTGVNATIKLSDRWLVQGGVSPGCDVAPWVSSDAKPTLNLCVAHTWRAGSDNVYICENSLNDGKYAYNNMQASYATWYHKFSSTWHSSTEFWYQYERDVPNVNNPAAASMLETNANGAVCDSPAELTCFAPEWAIVNYLENQVGPHDYLSIRNEYMDDMKGQRTGFKSRYSEHLLMWGHWVGTTILFRPELRFERAYDAPAYDNNTKQNQLTLAGDMLWFF